MKIILIAFFLTCQHMVGMIQIDQNPRPSEFYIEQDSLKRNLQSLNYAFVAVIFRVYVTWCSFCPPQTTTTRPA